MGAISCAHCNCNHLLKYKNLTAMNRCTGFAGNLAYRIVQAH